MSHTTSSHISKTNPAVDMGGSRLHRLSYRCPHGMFDLRGLSELAMATKHCVKQGLASQGISKRSTLSSSWLVPSC